MAAITQTISAYSGDVPDRATMTQSEFDAAATAWATWQEALPAQINTFGSQANSLRTDALGYQTGAQTAQANAETAEAHAETAQTAAETAQGLAEAARDAAENSASQAVVNGSIAGAAAANAPLYPSGAPYAAGACCAGSDGNTYRSLVGSNSANPVGDSSGSWQRLTGSPAARALFFGGF